MVRTTRQLMRTAAFALAIGLAPVSSLAAKATAASETVSIEERAASLEPGKYVWKPELATEGEVELVISLPLQMAYVYRGGTLIGAATISSGEPGRDTPIGRFNILQKRKVHFSNKYDNAPMPFMQRLTWSGVALHAGHNPGYPASHGCVRLPKSFAQKLFSVTELGGTVVITDQAPSAEVAYALLTRPEFQSAMGGPEEPLPIESDALMLASGGE